MTNKRETPAEALARRIGERMLKETLLQPERVENFVSMFAAGKLKEGDWRIELEASAKLSKPRKK